jgi:hypothetical protein
MTLGPTILFYGSALWTIKIDDGKQLISAKNTFYGENLGKRLSDCESNEDIMRDLLSLQVAIL